MNTQAAFSNTLAAAGPAASLQTLKPGAYIGGHRTGSGTESTIDKAAKQFEAVFLGEMFSHMFDGMKTDPLFGGGHAEKMYRSMLVQEYGKEMANGGGIGISSEIKGMMLKMQEQANKAHRLHMTRGGTT